MNEAKRSPLCGGKKEEEEKRDMGLLTMKTIKEKENGIIENWNCDNTLKVMY
jgi:hypothetical protein